MIDALCAALWAQKTWQLSAARGLKARSQNSRHTRVRTSSSIATTACPVRAEVHHVAGLDVVDCFEKNDARRAQLRAFKKTAHC